MNETGVFGGKVYHLLEDYKRPKCNLLEEYQKVSNGFLANEEVLVPLMNWFSNHKSNIKAIQRLNLNFFWVNKSVLNRGLVLGINKRHYLKYPKKNKEENELNFLIPYVCRLYGWSDKEYNFYKEFVDLEDEELHHLLHRKFALLPKELRKLGMKNIKIKCKYEGVSKIRGFF